MDELKFFTGDTWRFKVPLGRDGEPENVSEATSIKYVLGRNKAAVSPVKDASAGEVGAVWVSGVVMCPFTKVETAAIPIGEYTLQITVTYASTDEQTFETGVFTVAKRFIISV